MTPIEKQSAIQMIDESLLIFENQYDVSVKMMDVLEKSMVVFGGISPGLGTEDLEELVSINDLTAWISIVLSDISVISKSLLNAEGDWERLYFTRQSILLIFEGYKSYKERNEVMNNLVTASESVIFQQRFSEINLQIKNHKRQLDYYNNLQDMRNGVAGHISDFKTYAVLISKMDTEKVVGWLMTLLNIFKQMLELTKDMMTHITKELEKKVGSVDRLALEAKTKLEAAASALHSKIMEGPDGKHEKD